MLLKTLRSIVSEIRDLIVEGGTEHTVLFFSVVKWGTLATLVGALCGITTALFVHFLDWSSAQTAAVPYFYLIVPVALMITGYLGHTLRPQDDAHTTDAIIAHIHGSKRISIISMFKAFFLPVITVAAGGSAGKEAPCADVGAGVGSLLGSVLRFSSGDVRKLMICGVSAGFASVFGTPIGGAIFGVEVLFVGGLLYDVLLPSFIAGVISCQVAGWMGITYFHHPIAFSPVFSEFFFIKVVAAGLVFGVISAGLIEILRAGERLYEKWRAPVWLKRGAGGALIAVAGLTVTRQCLGLGLTTIENTLQGNPAAWYLFPVKSILTAVTLGFGGTGGIVTPAFFVGATSGAVFAQIFHLNVATFAALGLVGLLAGTANTPIAASIMAVELFGPDIAPYAAVTCVVSFLMTGHRSVYPSQVLAVRKAASLNIDMGKEIEDVHDQAQQGSIQLVQRQTRSVWAVILWAIVQVKRGVRRVTPDMLTRDHGGAQEPPAETPTKEVTKSED